MAFKNTFGDIWEKQKASSTVLSKQQNITKGVKSLLVWKESIVAGIYSSGSVK